MPPLMVRFPVSVYADCPEFPGKKGPDAEHEKPRRGLHGRGFRKNRDAVGGIKHPEGRI
jgi:hypothetical protein